MVETPNTQTDGVVDNSILGGIHVKNLKHAGAGLGIIGLVSVFLPWFKATDENVGKAFESLGFDNPFSLWDLGKLADKLGESPSGLYLLMVGFAVGAGALVFGIVKGGVTKKLASAAAGGFGIALWKAFQFRGDMPEGLSAQMGANLALLCGVAGLVISGLLIKNPEGESSAAGNDG